MQRKSLVRPARHLSSRVRSWQQSEVKPLSPGISHSHSEAAQEGGSHTEPRSDRINWSGEVYAVSDPDVISWDRMSCLFAQLGTAPVPHFASLLPSAEKPGLDFVSINRSHQCAFESDKHLQCL